MTRILVIDDDAAVRRTVSIMLSGKGFEIVEAENGRAGIDAINVGLPELHQTIAADPLVSDKCRIAVIAFSDRAVSVPQVPRQSAWCRRSGHHCVSPGAVPRRARHFGGRDSIWNGARPVRCRSVASREGSRVPLTPRRNRAASRPRQPRSPVSATMPRVQRASASISHRSPSSRAACTA